MVGRRRVPGHDGGGPVGGTDPVRLEALEGEAARDRAGGAGRPAGGRAGPPEGVATYSGAEAAALELTEAVTLCAGEHVPDTVWAPAVERFGTPELAALVALTVTVNARNRIGIATRTWRPEMDPERETR